MPKLDVSVKNAGKSYKVVLDTDAPAAAFKQIVSDATGVPIDRMKVMIKGGILKVRPMSMLHVCYTHYCPTVGLQDDTDWRKVAPKAVSVELRLLHNAARLIHDEMDRDRHSW